MPIQGHEDIQRYVTTSRDAIQYLWDQAIRYINKGYTPAELQQQLRKLPDYLDLAPFTRPMYGTEWIIAPEFYTGWVSWFAGDATDLSPTEPVEKAGRFVRLMGGRDKVMAEAEQAFREGDVQFTDSADSYTVQLRNSILEVHPGPAPAGTARVRLTATALRGILAGDPAPADIGDIDTLRELLGYLDRDLSGFYMHLR